MYVSPIMMPTVTLVVKNFLFLLFILKVILSLILQMPNKTFPAISQIKSLWVKFSIACDEYPRIKKRILITSKLIPCSP